MFTRTEFAPKHAEKKPSRAHGQVIVLGHDAVKCLGFEMKPVMERQHLESLRTQIVEANRQMTTIVIRDNSMGPASGNGLKYRKPRSKNIRERARDNYQVPPFSVDVKTPPKERSDIRSLLSWLVQDIDRRLGKS